jgi:transposase
VSDQPALLDIPEQPEPEAICPVGMEAAPTKPRFIVLDRNQMRWTHLDLDTLIAPDHPARAIWALVNGFDLQEFEQDCLNRGERAGRPSWSAQVLIGIWVYAYSQGMASARAIERAMAWEPGLRWLAADQSINYHTLSDFRMSRKARLDGLFVKLLAVLQSADLVDLQTLLQDGTKVRAQASKESFHRRKSLEEHCAEAQQVLAELEECGEPEAEDRRCQAARERAGREKAARLQAALEELKQREAETGAVKERAKLRVSETEPEARKMKHADGGWAPSYNVQVTTEAKSRVIAAVEVTDAPNDTQELLPAVERVSRITGRRPAQMIADGGYVSRENVERLSERTVELIAPWKDSDSRSAGACVRQGIAEEFWPAAFTHDPVSDLLVCPQGRCLRLVKVRQHHDVPCNLYEASAADCQACEAKLRCCPRSPARRIERVIESEAMQSFQRRMETAEARQLYHRRSEVAEFPHMWWKGTWKWRRFSVRGLAKAAKEALWLAIAYNVQQWIRLCWRRQFEAA